MKKFLFIVIVIIIIIPIVMWAYNYSKEYETYDAIPQSGIFNTADLKTGDLPAGISVEDVKRKLGDPNYNQDFPSFDETGPVTVLTYDGLTLTFYNNILLSKSIKSDKYNIKGLSVGSSYDDVVNSFYVEGGDTHYAFDSKESVIGTYIYGTFNVYNFNVTKTTSSVYYAFRSLDTDEKSTNTMEELYIGYDYYVKYVYMCPPYKNEEAVSSDKKSDLIFYFKDDKVFQIDWNANL